MSSVVPQETALFPMESKNIKVYKPIKPIINMETKYNLREEFKVHTPELFQRIIEMDASNKSGVMKHPINIFRKLLIEVGKRASELNDQKLNALMCKLTIYAIADPYDKDYNPELVNKILKEERGLK